MSQRLSQIETKLDELIRRHRQLQSDFNTLRQREQDWAAEKARLIEKNDMAKARIEDMIQRLKQLETDAE